MELEQLSFGRVNTHLDSLFAQIESALAGKKHEWEQALKRIHEDPVYRAIATGVFPMPVRSSVLSNNLQQRLQRIGQQAGARYGDIQAFLDATERFIASYHAIWDEHCYFIVPVVAKAGETKTFGLGYLQAKPKMIAPRAPSAALNIEDLTRDPRLLSFTEDYFGRIASVLMKTIYYVQHYPYDWFYTLTDHRYRLHFGCQITEGKSIGAAALAMFAVVHLQNILGDKLDHLVAPQCGTVLTGEVDVDGRVRRVEDLTDKVACAVEEFGSGLKFVLPRDEQLPESLERRIDRGNLHYVSTAEELLAAVFSSSDGFRGFEQARAALFKELTKAQKSKLKKVIIEGIDLDVYDKLPTGHSVWTTPKQHEGGVYVVSTAWNNRMDVKLSLELSGLQDADEANHRHELVAVLLDGSEPMSAHWTPAADSEICKLTAVLHEINHCIDSDKQELVCGFLSHQKFYSIKHGEAARDLEKFLQEIRQKARLQHRGSFFRPVYELLLKEHQDKLKRMYVISDCAVPDLDDLKSPNLSSLMRLRLLNNKIASGIAPEPDAILFTAQGKLDKTALGLYFQSEHGTIREIKIDLGEELPIGWEPHTGGLTLEVSHFVLRFEVNELKSEIKIQMAYERPPAIKINGQISRDEGPTAFAFAEHPTLTALKPLELARSGRLQPEEFEAWRKFDTSEWRCPACDSSESHLLDAPEGRFRERLVLASLRELSGGYLLMRAGSPDWVFFQTGYQTAGVAFAVIDGELHWSQARGHVEEVPYESGFYCLRTDAEVFYLGRVV